jgi:Protein of unknown function (DUF2946)
MLKRLRTGLGFRLAMAIAMFAALCFVAPPAMMAFGHGSNRLHCLSHGDVMGHGMAMDHGMQSAAAGHKDGDHAKLPGDKGCCGLFCASAIAPGSAPVVEVLPVTAVLAPPVTPRPANRAPERIDRPPISLLSA